MVDTHGIGWRLLVPSGTFDGVAQGEEVSLLVHTSVRQDAITLYGFTSAEQMDAFHTLVTVQGMGPTLALSLLGCMTVEDMATAIVEGDTKSLCRAHGVGAQIAKRLVAELGRKHPFQTMARGRDVEKPVPGDVSENMRADAVRALMRLDISKSDATAAVLDSMRQNPGLSKVEDLVRVALMSTR